jgi:Tfp pilus assembly protein PilO
VSKNFDIRSLDMNNPGSWPLPAKVAAGALLGVLLIGAVYWFYIKD